MNFVQQMLLVHSFDQHHLPLLPLLQVGFLSLLFFPHLPLRVCSHLKEVFLSSRVLHFEVSHFDAIGHLTPQLHNCLQKINVVQGVILLPVLFFNQSDCVEELLESHD